ncbi:MAG TPA: hypothetical protein IAC31_02780 [Candidatus Faecousia intestinigallinarum]|nr:hypothetical protein [Candidatus Faecousia intestinigallinarum]
MKKLIILLLCCLILVGMLLTGCSDTSGVPKEVREFAQTYLDACKEEEPESSMRMTIYCPSIIDAIFEGYRPEISNRILEMKTLGPKLWLMRTEREDMSWGKREFDQFVVDYDGRYLIALSFWYIPAECKEGLDLSEYEVLDEDRMLPPDVGTIATLPPE